MNIEIEEDDLSDGAVMQLLNSHLQEMRQYSPPESVHALDTQALSDSSITMWAARIEGKLAACAALKELSANTAELKSMKTSATFLRMGIAAKLLEVILAEAAKRGYVEVSLETGSDDAFKPAITLYEKHDFVECAPFGDYKTDPYSKFYSKRLL